MCPSLLKRPVCSAPGLNRDGRDEWGGGRSNKEILTTGESWHFSEKHKPSQFIVKLVMGLNETETSHCVKTLLVISILPTQ